MTTQGAGKPKPDMTEKAVSKHSHTSSEKE